MPARGGAKSSLSERSLCGISAALGFCLRPFCWDQPREGVEFGCRDRLLQGEQSSSVNLTDLSAVRFYWVTEYSEELAKESVSRGVPDEFSL